jgi:hypothetical protein
MMANTLDNEAVSAAIAGFLACHVLTCRFLVEEGIVDRDRFVAYLEEALKGLAPGMNDHRALFGVAQLINALRSPTPPTDLQ